MTIARVVTGQALTTITDSPSPTAQIRIEFTNSCTRRTALIKVFIKELVAEIDETQKQTKLLLVHLSQLIPYLFLLLLQAKPATTLLPIPDLPVLSQQQHHIQHHNKYKSKKQHT